MTQVLSIKLDSLNSDDTRAKIRVAAEVIRRGGTVAFPTETVYGLGANALMPEAVMKIFNAKERPADNPLIVHIASKRMLSTLVDGTLSTTTKKLVSHFWPGPLTLLFRKAPIVPAVVTCGLRTVAIRMPAHPIALALIRAAKTPIAAPSANLAGRPSPTTAEHVLQDLRGRIDIVIDGGRTNIGVESTVLDLTTEPPTILRPGGVPIETLRAVIGKEVKLHPVATADMDIEAVVALSPGMKYKHYAPQAKLVLVEGTKAKVIDKVRSLAREYSRKNNKYRIGILSLSGITHYRDLGYVVKFIGRNLTTAAERLFSTLREFDNENVDVIIAEGCPVKGLGLAIMNRLRKAASQRIVIK
jgi:L-threonylcarbamoyladenylate synthase